jgi:hypothetical protein
MTEDESECGNPLHLRLTLSSLKPLLSLSLSLSLSLCSAAFDGRDSALRRKLGNTHTTAGVGVKPESPRNSVVARKKIVHTERAKIPLPACE